MSDSSALAIVQERVQYPPFKIEVPASARAEDLVQAGNAAWGLATHAHFIVFWIDFALRPFGMSNTGKTVEDVLANLPEEVDRRIFECEELVAPLRLELVNPANCFSEGEFHAPCAHDAALRYATGIRKQLDTIARIATRTFTGWEPHQLIPGSVMRGRWREILQTYSEQKSKPFEALPSIHGLRNRLTVEVTSTIRARMLAEANRATAIRALPEKQREVLTALNGRALSLKALTELLGCDASRLHRDHLKPLMALGHVARDRKVGGYYRPDAPPTMA